jgi:hypothetical protein
MEPCNMEQRITALERDSDKRLFSPVVGTVVRAGWENPLVSDAVI